MHFINCMKIVVYLIANICECLFLFLTSSLTQIKKKKSKIKYIYCLTPQVTVMKSTFLDLKTMGENPTIDDLPISPLFGIVSAHCIAPSRIQDEKNYFTLSRKYHNPFTSTFATMDIPCFYDPNNGRHSSVSNATNGKAVFSVAGEFFLVGSSYKSLPTTSVRPTQLLKKQMIVKETL